MAVVLNSFICKRPFFANKKYFRESFANPRFIFREGLMLKSFAKSFAQKTCFRALRKKLSRGLMLKPGSHGNYSKNSYMDLQNDSHNIHDHTLILSVYVPGGWMPHHSSGNSTIRKDKMRKASNSDCRPFVRLLNHIVSTISVHLCILCQLVYNILLAHLCQLHFQHESLWF